MALTKIGTDGVKDDAVTSGKIPANAVGSSELADNAVTTNKIGSEQIVASNIAGGTITAGKLASGVQTTINNNADNRVITGSGTANTLNGESNLFFNGTNLGIGGTAPNYQVHATSNMAVGGHGFAQQLTFSSTAIQSLLLGTGYRNMSLNALGGNVGIGTTTPESLLELASHRNAETDKFSASNYHLHLRNTENDNGEAIGISFAITSDETAVGAAILHERDAGGSQGSLQFLTNSNGSSVTERMRISSSGNVGIGTSTIGNKLQVHEGGSFGSFAGFSNDTTGSGSSDGMIVGLDSNEEGVLYHYENKAIRFGTNNSEKMRLTNVGQFLVGTTNNNGCSAKLIVQADSIPSYYANSGGLNVNVTNSNNIHCAEFFQGRYDKRCITHSHSNTGSVTFDVFEQADVTIGSITGNASNAAFNTASDYRLKENEVLISDGITRLKTLKPYKFNWKRDPSTIVDGFFAHEVQPIIPEAVTGEKDALEEDGSIDPQQMDYSKLTPLLTAALQEAIAKIEVLEIKVEALEAA
mgnify:CR=1 FL=1